MNVRTHIKMCGMTRKQDVTEAVNAGADSVGLNFYPPSPRYIEPARAALLAKLVPAHVQVVALFVNATAETVQGVIDSVKPAILQFHGDEEPAFCQQFGLPYIKALRVKGAEELRNLWSLHEKADYLLLDAFVPGVPGGTGEQFDWSVIQPDMTDRLFLAGGLTPDNVFGAIQQIHPFAVDVAGGIELEKGIKSAEKMRHFAHEVRRADSAVNEFSS